MRRNEVSDRVRVCVCVQSVPVPNRGMVLRGPSRPLMALHVARGKLRGIWC